MSGFKIYSHRLECDAGGCLSMISGSASLYPTLYDLRRRARTLGWTRKLIDGVMQDHCPEHAP